MTPRTAAGPYLNPPLEMRIIRNFTQDETWTPPEKQIHGGLGLILEDFSCYWRNFLSH